jgi:hypothetical protein
MLRSEISVALVSCLLSLGAAGSPRLLVELDGEAEPGAHGGWLLAQAPATTVVSTTDGNVYSGVLVEDLPAGLMLRVANGETVFIERARIRTVARPAGGQATAPAASPSPGDGPPPPPPLLPPAISAAPGTPAPMAGRATTQEDLAEGRPLRNANLMQRAEVNDELRLIDRVKPRTGGFLALALAGAAITALGAIDMIISGAFLAANGVSSTYKRGSITTVFIIGVVADVVGVTMLVIGIIGRAANSSTVGRYDSRTRDLEDRLQHLEDQEHERGGPSPLRP